MAFSVALPSLWVAHCHCSLCRMAHGAAFVTWMGVEADSARIRDDEDLLQWFQSSPGAERGFCSRCGTTLFFRSVRWPGELHVTRASFTSAVDRAPQAHVYFDTRVDWIHIADDLPKKDDPGPAD